MILLNTCDIEKVFYTIIKVYVFMLYFNIKAVFMNITYSSYFSYKETCMCERNFV